jgi:Tfp pilus assembly protein PilF
LKQRFSVPDDVRPQRERRMQQSIEMFERQRNDAQYQAACAFFRQGQFAVCQEHLTGLLSRCHDHRAASLLLTDTFVEQGKLDESRKHAEAAAKRFSHDADFAHALAGVYELQGEETLALASFERAAELALGLDPDANQPQVVVTSDPELSDALAEASACLERGEPDEALEQIKPLLDAVPNSAEVHLIAGRVFQATGDAVEATYQFELASGHLDPDDADTAATPTAVAETPNRKQRR